MARYTWKFDNRVFTSLRELQAAAEEIVRESADHYGLDLVYDLRTGKAVKELEVSVKVRSH
jgi:hypothetical protein